MACTTVKMGDTYAIVCGPRPRRKKCVAPGCGKLGTLLCDWKVGTRMNNSKATCDASICADHAQRVAPDKDLCPEHQKAYAAYLAHKKATRRPPEFREETSPK